LLPLSPQSVVVLLNQGLARQFDCFGLRFPKSLIRRLGKFSRCTLRSKGFHLTPQLKIAMAAGFVDIGRQLGDAIVELDEFRASATLGSGCEERPSPG
jgi:hypothetical protein